VDKSRRKELKEEFKQIKTYMGIYQIKNNVNGKIYVDSCPNLKNKWLTLKMQLETGRFANSQLQKDWSQLGADAFVYEVLEKKEVEEDIDKRWHLKQMAKQWMEKLQPYGDRGYNKPTN
jgi:hypothetical protein